MAKKQTAGRDQLGDFAPKFAELNDKASKVCPYCNSVIVSRNNNWVLSNKTSKSQRIQENSR